MEECIFGTLATDELKLAHHRRVRRGLQHRHNLSPRDPGPGQPVALIVHVGPDLAAEHVACYYTLDGSEPSGAHGVASNGHVLMLEQAEVVWDTLIWGYLTRWRGTLPPQSEGTVVRYRIGAWAGDGLETFADWPEVHIMAEHAAVAFFRGEPLPNEAPGDPGRGHTFTYHVDRWHPADLGATCLWLSPIFPSPSHHGYDATDLNHVEPRLGDDDVACGADETLLGFGANVLLEVMIKGDAGMATFYVVDSKGDYSEAEAKLQVDLSGSTLEVALPYTDFGKPDAGDVFRLRAVVSEGEVRDVQVMPGAGPAQLVVSDLGLTRPILTIVDPEKDDHGPGNYTYPLDGVFSARAYDLTEFAVAEDDNNLIFRFTFAGPLNND